MRIKWIDLLFDILKRNYSFSELNEVFTITSNLSELTSDIFLEESLYNILDTKAIEILVNFSNAYTKNEYIVNWEMKRVCDWVVNQETQSILYFLEFNGFTPRHRI